MKKGIYMRNAKILLAEDSEDLAETMVDALGGQGYSVIVAKNGMEVLQHPSLGSVDLIIMDMQMPVMDGLTATRKLREQGCKIPILACTGMQDSLIRQKVLAAGCSSYVEKPIDFASFFSLVAKLGDSACRDF
jgi:two-component system sensor histidine kinase/response regulator